MLHFDTSSPSEQSPLSFVERNPYLADSLLADCDYDLNAVTKLIEPALRAPQRCQVSGLYIQAIVTNQTIFLTTNLTDGKEFRLTTLGSSWLIGRNSTCSILIKSGSVSRCHAVLGCHPTDGFYMTDLGSTNGTWVNCHRLPSHERQGLRDGDLLQFGKMKVEFFLSSCRETDISLQEATYF